MIKQDLPNGAPTKTSFNPSSILTWRYEEITVQSLLQKLAIPGTSINQSDITNPKIVFSLITFIIVGLILSVVGAVNLVLSGVMTVYPSITWTELNFYSLIMWVGLFLIFTPLISVIVVEGISYFRRRQRTPAFSTTPRERRRERPQNLPSRPYRPNTHLMNMPPLDQSQSSSQEKPLWPLELAPLRPVPPTSQRPDLHQVRVDKPETSPTSPQPSPPSISKLTKRIRRLEAKVKRLQKQVSNPKVPRKYAATLGEMASRQEANDQLLEALNAQRTEGRITSRFYRRKRKQLTEESPE